jgi:glycosyltransferase involved in cell wall biosynthesis
MKVFIVVNSVSSFYAHRKGLVEKLKSEGHKVCLVLPCDSFSKKQLEKQGHRVLPIFLNRKSLNPFNELKCFIELINLYLNEKPDLVHHFTIKPAIYGSIAAKCSGVKKVISTITGLGHVFIDDGFKMDLLRPLVKKLYRFALDSKRSKTIFQNNDDYQYFVKNKLVKPRRAELVPGSGVNISYFRPAEGDENRVSSSKIVNVLFTGRMLREKGIVELIEAADRLALKHMNFKLFLAGDIDEGNPSSISREEIEQWQKREYITWLGFCSDMKSLYQRVDIVCLPSYREGLSKALLEAAACALPIVTTDAPGCRDLVEDGVNGYLVPVKESSLLEAKLEQLISDASRRKQFGLAGRSKVINHYSSDIINRKIIDIYGKVG